MRLFPFCSLIALAPALCAQTIVSPTHFTAVEGNSYESISFASTSVPYWLQQIHGDLQGTPRTLNSISFRRDGQVAQTSSYSNFSVLCDLYVSTSVNPPGAPNAMFAQNHGTDKAQLAAFQLVQFPSSVPGGLTRSWDYKIPFSRPFSFGGTGPLCWELRITSSTLASGFYLDRGYSSSTNPSPYVDQLGTGCKATGKSAVMSMTGSSSPNWAQNTLTVNYNGSNFPNNALVTLAIGNSTTSWSGVPLPFELPGSAGAASGKCTVYNNWLISVPQLANGSGNMSAQLGLGVIPAYNGGNLYAQVAALDAMANSFGVVMSNTVQHQILAPFTTVPVGSVYATNVSGNGNARANDGLVVKFD